MMLIAAVPRVIIATFVGWSLVACAPTSQRDTHVGGAPEAASESAIQEAVTIATKLTPGVFLEEAQSIPESAPLRTVDSQGVLLTKESEGFVGHLYNDSVGYCTVAYGHLIHKSPCNGTEPATFRPTVSEAEGTSLLIADMAVAQYAVMTAAHIELTDDQFASLVDFTYNVGTHNFSTSTLLQLINAHNFTAVPAEWNKWILADGKMIDGLAIRRQREIDLFFDGQPPQEAHVESARPQEKAVKLIDIRVGG